MNVKKMIARDGLIILGVVLLGGIIASQYFDDRFVLLKQYFSFIKKILKNPSWRSDIRVLVLGLSPLFVFVVWAVKTLRKP